jgi:hypothetical protein
MKNRLFVLLVLAFLLPLQSSAEQQKDTIKITYGLFLKKVVPNFKV